MEKEIGKLLTIWSDRADILNRTISIMTDDSDIDMKEKLMAKVAYYRQSIQELSKIYDKYTPQPRLKDINNKTLSQAVDDAHQEAVNSNGCGY